jgi:hypothetical protein
MFRFDNFYLLMGRRKTKRTVIASVRTGGGLNEFWGETVDGGVGLSQLVQISATCEYFRSDSHPNAVGILESHSPMQSILLFLYRIDC